MHRQSCTPPPPLMDSCSNVSELEVTDDSLGQEEHKDIQVSNVGTLKTVDAKANISCVDKFQEDELKVRQLEVCLKEKKEHFELFLSDYIKVIDDMKQINHMQDLKIYKYECNAEILKEEAKVENQIKGIKEGQLEWTKKELMRHKAENRMLKHRTQEQARTVENLKETLNLAIKINTEKVIPHSSAATGAPEDSPKTLFVSEEETQPGMTKLQVNKKSKLHVRPSTHPLLHQPLKCLPLQPAVTRKRSQTKAGAFGENPLAPSKVLKLSDHSEMKKHSLSDPDLTAVPQEMHVRKTGFPVEGQTVWPKGFSGRNKRLGTLQVAPLTSGKSSSRKFGVKWNVSRGSQAKVMKFPKFQLKSSLHSLPKFLLRTPWEGSTTSSKEPLGFAEQRSSERAFPIKSPSEPSATLNTKEVDADAGRHSQGDWGSVGRRREGQDIQKCQ